MAEVKWIKIVTDIFNDEKMRYIETLPSGETLIVVWFKILCLAGRSNTNGMLMMTERIPYTEQMLASIFGKDIKTIQFSLNVFSELEMIEIVDSKIYVLNWQKHQNIEGLEKLREQGRIRTARYREKKMIELEHDVTQSNGECNVTVTHGNETERELERELEEDKEKTTTVAVPFSKIKDLYNSTCTTLSKIKIMSENRKTHVRARWTQYGEDYSIFETLFSKAEESTFLQGKNNRGWKADFDWLMNETNMSKVLEGKYENEINKGNVKPRFEQSEEIKPF